STQHTNLGEGIENKPGSLHKHINSIRTATKFYLPWVSDKRDLLLTCIIFGSLYKRTAH
ncbi:hypothetical protein ACJX0J_037662, partial [Zea mays]